MKSLITTTTLIIFMILSTNIGICRSRLDDPEKGTYRGFMVNESSYHQEVKIWSVRDQKFIDMYSKILQPRRLVLKNNPVKDLDDYNDSQKRIWKNHSPQVMKLDLKLGEYVIHVRERADITDKDKVPGEWQEFPVILNEQLINSIPGPFTWEITDENNDENQENIMEHTLLNYLIMMKMLQK